MKNQLREMLNIEKAERKEQKEIFPKRGKSRCSQKTIEKQRIS